MHTFILKHKGKVLEQVQADKYNGSKALVGCPGKRVFQFYSRKVDLMWEVVAEIVAPEGCSVLRSDAVVLGAGK